MAYDSGTGQLVLFGGNDGNYLNDTWTWNGTNWTQLNPATSPGGPGAGRFDASMAYDSGTGQLTLFGGNDGNYLSDIWTWNGSTWTTQSATTSPSARFGASMAYDPGTGQLVLFGGNDGNYLNDTWTYGYPPATSYDWTQQSPSTSPSARYGASMAYDPGSGQLVLFGGGSVVAGSGVLDDTWTWNSTAWTQLSPATSPPAREAASMAYDPGTGQLVLFGGQDQNAFPHLNDTWTWNGTTWTQQSPTNSPSVRSGASMAYDPSTGQLVLFGGAAPGSVLLGDTWTWNGTNWTQLNEPTGPPARWFASMAYDPGTGQLVLFGGQDNSTRLDDTWTYGPAGGPPAGTPEVPVTIMLPVAAMGMLGIALVIRRRRAPRAT
jgi:hypothetical protein